MEIKGRTGTGSSLTPDLGSLRPTSPPLHGRIPTTTASIQRSILESSIHHKPFKGLVLLLLLRHGGGRSHLPAGLVGRTGTRTAPQAFYSILLEIVFEGCPLWGKKALGEALQSEPEER